MIKKLKVKDKNIRNYLLIQKIWTSEGQITHSIWNTFLHDNITLFSDITFIKASILYIFKYWQILYGSISLSVQYVVLIFTLPVCRFAKIIQCEKCMDYPSVYTIRWENRNTNER